MFWNSELSPLKLICDIGSATVSLAVVDTSKKIPEIVFTTKVPLVVQEIFDQDKNLVAKVKKTLYVKLKK